MDELDRENQRYTIEVRNRAARLMREQGLPMFDAMEEAQKQIADERKRETRSRAIAGLAQLCAWRR